MKDLIEAELAFAVQSVIAEVLENFVGVESVPLETLEDLIVVLLPVLQIFRNPFRRYC